ncbi:wax ester synthase/diacylglycerol acyltransferase 11-like [Wolffia australiana]
MERGTWSGVSSALYMEPVSPAGQLFLQPEMELSIDSFVQFQNAIDILAVKEALKSVVKTCPRLRSVVTKTQGRQHWKELPELNIDNHVIIVFEQEEEEDNRQAYINNYLTSLPSMAALSRNSPFWEVHILPERYRSLVLRLHHALGDCVSLLAIVLSCCDAPLENKPISAYRIHKERPSFAAPLVKVAASVWQTLKRIGNTIPLAIELSTFSFRGKENMRLIVQGELETTRRKLASVALSLDGMKAVKNKLNATLNDVFVGIVSYGISRYLGSNLSKASKNGTIRAVVAVNIRGQGSKEILRSIREGKSIAWGNKIGYFTLPIPLENKDDPLSYVRKAKSALDKKKLSFGAQYSYNVNALITNLFGIETMASIDYKFRHNTSILFSNVVGPSCPTKLGGNPITHIGVTLSRLSAAMDIHMISYNGKAFIQFLVAEDIIPEPELLCMYVQEALIMMNADDSADKKTAAQ